MNTKKGFTLIELLVVIAIIGILASVVLASLQTARNRGADSAVKASLSNARAQAELFYETNGNVYDGPNTSSPDTDSVCQVSGSTPGPGGINTLLLGAAAQSNDTTLSYDAIGAIGNSTCNDTATGWAAEMPLKGDTGAMWCVDSTGKSGRQTATSLSAANDVTCI